MGQMLVGLLGKPSSGKSSFFKAATMIDVAIADYPFTTIKPNLGTAFVTTDCVCKQFEVKCNPKNSQCVDGKRLIPVKLMDVAGLVPGSHEGKGMGNQFLDDLRQASCLIHIVDASGKTDAEGKAASGYDPSNDVKFLEKEIDLWFASIIDRALGKFVKKAKHVKVELLDILTEHLAGLQISREHIAEALSKASIDNLEEFATELRKISKPIIIAANKIDLSESKENFEKLQKDFPDFTVIPTSAAAEIALRNADNKGFIEYKNNDFTIKNESQLDSKQLEGLNFIKENVLKKHDSTGIQECLNRAFFDVLNLIVVYPVANINKLTDNKENVLPDAFLIKKGTTLKQFAEKVHSTMAEQFIGGMEAKTKRKLGADYKLKNNDVVEILFQKR